MPNSRKRHYSSSRSRSSDHSNNDSENKRKKYDEKSHDEGHRNNKSNDNYSPKGSLSFEREVESRSAEEETHQNIERTSPVANIKSQDAESVKGPNTKLELNSDDKTSKSIIEHHTKNNQQCESGKSTEDDKNEVKNEDFSIIVDDDVECTLVDDDQNESDGNSSKSKEEPQDLDKSTSEDDKTRVKSAMTSFTTPKKLLTPKKLQQKLESEKKRLDRQKEKEEREKRGMRKRNESCKKSKGGKMKNKKKWS